MRDYKEKDGEAMNETQSYKQKMEVTKPKEPWIRKIIVAFFLSGLIATITEFFIRLLKTVFLLEEESATEVVIIFWMIISLFLTKTYCFRKMSYIAAGGFMFSLLGFFNAVFSVVFDAREEGLINGTSKQIFTQIGLLLTSYYILQWIFLSKG